VPGAPVKSRACEISSQAFFSFYQFCANIVPTWNFLFFLPAVPETIKILNDLQISIDRKIEQGVYPINSYKLL